MRNILSPGERLHYRKNWIGCACVCVCVYEHVCVYTCMRVENNTKHLMNNLNIKVSVTKYGH